MITPNMNKLEINRHIIKAIQHYHLKLENGKKAFQRICKRSPKANISKTEIVEWRQEHQKYVAVWSQMFGYVGYHMVAIVDHGRKQWYYEPQFDLTDTMNAYSTHFFMRYAERTSQPSLFPNIIGKYYVRNPHRFLIYRCDDGIHRVYACREGIELCVLERERGVIKFCTFVSCSMFGDTQREAWKTVQCKLDEADRIVRSGKSKIEGLALFQEWAKSSPELTNLATSIYDQYFHETEE